MVMYRKGVKKIFHVSPLFEELEAARSTTVLGFSPFLVSPASSSAASNDVVSSVCVSVCVRHLHPLYLLQHTPTLPPPTLFLSALFMSVCSKTFLLPCFCVCVCVNQY